MGPDLTSRHLTPLRSSAGMVGLAPKWVILDPKFDKSAIFWLLEANVLKADLKKSPDLSNFGSNLTHF